MEESQVVPAVSPRVYAQVMGVLCSKLAAQVDSSAEAVEPGHLVSGYLSDDPLVRHRLVVQLERAFGIPIDGNRFDSARTVGELGGLIAQKVQARKAGGEGGHCYVVCYRTTTGGLVETHVRAPNHNAAVDLLRVEGLREVVSIERDEDDSDDDPRAGRVRNAWTGCLLPILAAAVVAGGVFAFYWWRRG